MNRRDGVVAMRLSSGELEVMDVLWRLGALTIAEAHRGMPRRIGYTTVQTQLNRLVKKGAVERSEERPAKYRPVVSRESVGTGHLDELLSRVAGGNVVPLVAHLLERSKLSSGDIRELKRYIAAAEKDVRGADGAAEAKSKRSEKTKTRSRRDD